jgi:hypothetical protein
VAIETQAMTDEQRESVVLEYFRRMDRGEDVVELFDDHAEVYFPKWGVARGRDEIGRMFGEVGELFGEISHYSEYVKIVVDGARVGAEGMSAGRTQTGVRWRGGDTHAGRWCNVFEVRNFKIERCFIYLDPDYAGSDTDRYPWLAGGVIA